MWKDISWILWLKTFKNLICEIAWIGTQSKDLTPIQLVKKDTTNERYFMYEDVIWNHLEDSNTSYKIWEMSEIALWKIEKLW